MKTKKNILLMLTCSIALIVSCIKQPYYDIPLSDNGKPVITSISTTTSAGVTKMDPGFTVNATLPNAKAGDVMTAELCQLQIPSWGGASTQLLPLAGTKKQVTVGNDLKISITYTRTEAKLNNVGEYVVVTLSGDTESGSIKVTLESSLTVTNPIVSGKVVEVTRTAETAYFNATVKMKSAAYAGTLIVTRKNGKNGTEVVVPGSPFPNVATFLVPISGTDFAVGKDTMYYSFKVTSESYTEEVKSTVIVRNPYFYLKKTGVILTLGGSSAGRNILTNSAVAATNANAILAIDGGSLIIHGGSAWAIGGNEITFVPSTAALFDKNNLTEAIAAYAAGSPTATVDPNVGTGIYILKVKNGPNPEDVYYGMIKITGTIPGVSLTLEYRIGNQYAHLSKIS